MTAGSSHDVLIAGGGIGGLAAALRIAGRGFRVAVHERGGEPPEAGAGIQLGPNVTRILAGSGLLEPVAAVACKPLAIRVRDGLSGGKLARIALGERAEARYGAPYLVIHRGGLHRILHEAAVRHPRIDIEHGWDALTFEQNEAGVVLKAGDGRQAPGRVLIGADGLRSRVREKLLGSEPPSPSGHIAWRALIRMDDVPDEFRAMETGLWIGPDGHVVAYPVHAGAMLNIVAITPGRTDARGWSAEGGPAVLQNALKGWNRRVRRIVAVAREWRFWPLYDRPPSRHWGRGNVTLLGDAAHPVLPFLAQGGAMAIEDAAVIADCLAADLRAPERALARYEDLRRDRTARVRSASRENAGIFHLDGGMRRARNTVLRVTNVFAPSRLLARYDWLYGYDAMAAVGDRPEVLTD